MDMIVQVNFKILLISLGLYRYEKSDKILLRIYSEDPIKGEEIIENRHIHMFYKFEMGFKTFKKLETHKEVSIIVDAVYLKKSAKHKLQYSLNNL